MKRTNRIGLCALVLVCGVSFCGCKALITIGSAVIKAAAESEKDKSDTDHIDLEDDKSIQTFSSSDTFKKLSKFHGDLSKVSSSKNLYTLQVNNAEARKYETGYIYPAGTSSRAVGDTGVSGTPTVQPKITVNKTPDFVTAFNEDPESFLNKYPSQARTVTTGVIGGESESGQSSYDSDPETRVFKVAKNMTDTNNEGTPKTGKLVKTGDFCLIYLATDVDFSEVSADGTFFAENPESKISQDKIDSLAKTFDDLYPYITGVMGDASLSSPIKYASGNSYRYTVSDNTAVCPEKVIIFINDIFDDQTNGNVLGYFWAADLLKQSDFENSNGCKMFYLDSYFLMKDQIENTKICDSTLAHEFTHMLNVLNKKILGIDNWFTEMLAMTCEDLVSGVKNDKKKSILGFDTKSSSSVFVVRLPYFNILYGDGFSSEVWGDSNTYASAYSNTYAFGAYLLRNYGGVKLINQIATNSEVGEAAINDALTICGYSSETFKSVLSKFGQVLINTDNYSFTNKTVSLNKGSTLSFNGKSYVIFPIDLTQYYVKDSDSNKTYTGPILKDNQYRYSIGGWGVEVKEFGSVSNYSSFDAQLPTNQSCDLYVYLK